VADIKGWSTGHPQAQSLLVHFFRAIGKQQQLAHVWIATSKEDIKSWVTAGVEAMNTYGTGETADQH
jgi:hypothetical protein